MSAKSRVWHPFTQHAITPGFPTITRTQDACLYTDEDSYIDAISSWWVTTHGHCNPRIQAAIRKATESYDQLIFANFTHEPGERLADALVNMAPAGLEYVFYSDSGSTAVEVALKMALSYWSHTGTPREQILVLQDSYHGDTIGTMSIGARGVCNAPYTPLMFEVATIPFPEAGREQSCLDALEIACSTNPKPAAFIVEPLVLGAGGMRMYASETLKAMYEICARHDVLFIADEVMTGWGRTGTLFACEQAGINPDILCLSKGLTGGSIPLAVTLTRSELFEAHYSKDRSKLFFHSSSYTANPIACAAALENLAIWEDEPVLERIGTLAQRQSAHLDELANRPELENARQAGTITAIDVVTDGSGYLSDIAPRLTAYAMERGIFIRPLGNTIYTMPPYCITPDELSQVYATVSGFLSQQK